MRHLIVMLLLSVTAPTAAHACKCLWDDDAAKRAQASWERATDVVVVKVKADQLMEVVEVLKGSLPVGHTAKQTLGSTCALSLREGAHYLVFSVGKVLHATQCSGTRLLQGPDVPEVVELRQRKAP